MLLALAGLLHYVARQLRKEGAVKQELKTSKEALKNVKKANNAESDGVYDDKLRKKYSVK